MLTLRLRTGYKMYIGLEFSWTFLAGTEKQSYHFFYLFVLVPLTRHYQHSARILLFTCMFFFQIQLDQFVPMLVKNVSNTCSAKTYYINRLTHKNCKRVTTSNPTVQLTDWWAHILQSRDISSHRWSCELYFLVLKHYIYFTLYNWMKTEKSE
jgi:hypothetical protein